MIHLAPFAPWVLQLYWKMIANYILQVRGNTEAIFGHILPGKTINGCNNVIGHHVVVGIKCQDMKYKGGEIEGTHDELLNEGLLAAAIE
ncbi:putative acyl-[acyl-carrier-protein]--UDP-N-acetylglucosamine O-acyltransferase, mitochondrial [Artemisia annua]|uniref:Putative acyl-[acyl-carrier-protein]--UDP-N-acetylglucosamine O-acyltransferase, mitochondrial n=1 Tax=Artemisia annua TaxID=35608 RepID=A0A2U1PTW6_ARTAN|nr:putative acyl-[acyl-carrier-protein]--UDP-N-acetylglucosamine O-acyltransferase, mitochondrial [Artemisia annua]